jgi:hypothetical protein
MLRSSSRMAFSRCRQRAPRSPLLSRTGREGRECVPEDDVLMLPEWDRARASVFDGIQIIQRAARGALVKVLDKPYLTSNTMGRVGEHVLVPELALRKIANRKRPRLGGVSSRSRKRAGSITPA